MTMPDLPSLPGVYILELALTEDVTLDVGRLGRACFPRGALLYTGSARGPGDLKARLGRHLKDGRITHPHWHIDALHGVARPRAVAYLIDSHPALECLWSQALAQLPGSCVPLLGFGASDCRSGCPAHLVAFAGEGKDNHPLLGYSGWLQRLSLLAGAPPSALTIARLPG
jgi:Uri superfamily endonuclease